MRGIILLVVFCVFVVSFYGKVGFVIFLGVLLEARAATFGAIGSVDAVLTATEVAIPAGFGPRQMSFCGVRSTLALRMELEVVSVAL